MNIFPLSPYCLTFPDVSCATEEGIVAYGGDLSVNRILNAYSGGIFPWFKENDPILWWSLDPRFVLDLNDFKVPKSLKRIMRKDSFEIRFNCNFKQVIENCSLVKRKDQSGSWITKSMKEAFFKLYDEGYICSFEAYNKQKQLVGGGYGLTYGDVFYGESMFSFEKNASKIAFVHLVEKLKNNNFSYVDCKVYSEHMFNFGAKNITREDFLKIVKKSKFNPCNFQ